jgi:hypothetical protein
MKKTFDDFVKKEKVDISPFLLMLGTKDPKSHPIQETVDIFEIQDFHIYDGSISLYALSRKTCIFPAHQKLMGLGQVLALRLKKPWESKEPPYMIVNGEKYLLQDDRRTLVLPKVPTVLPEKGRKQHFSIQLYPTKFLEESRLEIIQRGTIILTKDNFEVF